MAALGSLVVELNANIAKFESAMNRAAYVSDQNMKAVGRSVDSLKSTIQGIAGVIAGAFAIEGFKGFLDAMTEVGAKTEKLRSSMEAMGGIYGVSEGSLRLVSDQIQAMGMTASEAAGSINQFLKYGVEITKLPSLGQMAKDLSAIDNEGRSTREIFDLLVNAIGRGPRALMQLRLGSGEAFKAMAADIKETQNEAFLSMPERANLAFKLIEQATRDFSGVSSSVMDTYKSKQAEATKAAEEFKVALFDLAKPVLSAVIQQEINSWAAFTAALANNHQALSQTGETLALVVGRIASSVGTVVSFVAAHREWAEALLGLYGMSRLIALVGGLAAALTTALISVGQFIAGLTTLKGLVSSPWPPVVITVTAVGVAATLTALQQVIQKKLEAAGALNPNLMEKSGAFPQDTVLSPEGTRITPQQNAKIISDYDERVRQEKELNTLAGQRIGVLEQQLKLGTSGTAQERLATLEAVRAARLRQEQVKTTVPKPGGGGGGGADAEARRLLSLFDTLNRDISKLSEGSLAEVDANLAKTLDQIYSREEQRVVSAADLEIMAKKRAALQKEKIEEEFNIFVANESGNAYVQIEAQAKAWLDKYRGLAGAEEAIAGIKNRKLWEEEVRQYTDRLNLQKSFLDDLANAAPLLSQQLAIKQQILPLEAEIARYELERKMAAMGISEAQKDELRGLQALSLAAKKYAQERESWMHQGPGGGLQSWAADRGKEMETRGAQATMDFMKSAETWIGDTGAQAFIDKLHGKKADLMQMFSDLGDAAFKKIFQMGTQRGFDLIAKAIGIPGVGKMGTMANPMWVRVAGAGLGGGQGRGLTIPGLSGGEPLIPGFGQAESNDWWAGLDQAINEMDNSFATGSAELSTNAGQYGAMFAQSSGSLAQVGTGWGNTFMQFLQGLGDILSSVLGGGGGGLFGDLLGGIGGLVGGALLAPFTGGTSLVLGGMSSVGTFASMLHHGGVIRAHGGWPRLAPDEVPIIAQTGERILSRAQNRDFEAGVRTGGGPVVNAPISITINPQQKMTQGDLDDMARMIKIALNKHLAPAGKNNLGDGKYL